MRRFFDALVTTVDLCFLGELLAPNLARPRLAAPPSAPTRPARGVSGFWIRQVPGHALHYKDLQKKKSVVPLVGSQKQRALLVPVINRG